MFGKLKFNQNLSSWNVSNVTNCGSFANKTPDWNLPNQTLQIVAVINMKTIITLVDCFVWLYY